MKTQSLILFTIALELNFLNIASFIISLKKLTHTTFVATKTSFFFLVSGSSPVFFFQPLEDNN